MENGVIVFVVSLRLLHVHVLFVFSTFLDRRWIIFLINDRPSLLQDGGLFDAAPSWYRYLSLDSLEEDLRLL